MAKKFKIDLKKFIKDFSGYRHFISFVGNPSEEVSLEVLCELVKYYKNKIHIFSDEKNFLKSIEKIKKNNMLEENDLKVYSNICKGNAETEEERAEIYNSSKINLSIDSRKRPLTTNQIFEILASGGFLIANEREDIAKYFEDSRHLETFFDTADLVDKIDFYLQNLNIAQKIAQLGKFEIIKNYAISLNPKKAAIKKHSQSL